MRGVRAARATWVASDLGDDVLFLAYLPFGRMPDLVRCSRMWVWPAV